ncbi:PAS domain S-box protein [Natronorubrum sp. DTA7]|uniref:PAS domain S-box protein n=1 Tax=Natronorubrum sp. DTA7 TaxID=3447016 RepID=UPI003F83BD16
MATLESARASYDSITSVLDEANIGVFVLDDAFEVAWADETIERYFGLDRDALIGRDKRRVVHELVADTVDESDRFAETVLATYDDNSYIKEFECRITAGDDREERWLEHRSKPIESGEYAGGRIELYYDITDRKRSEDARRETEEQFQSLVDAVEEDAIFRLDPAGHVVSWNEGATEIKGYDAEEILGEHVSTFYTEDDRAAGVPERNLERATEAGSIEDDGWRVRKDGTRFWANVTITAVRDEAGSPRGYLKITRDMTDRYERERELESELQQVFGRISDAFYAVDEEYRFTHVNDRAEKLLQHSEEELLGENLWDAFPAIDRMDDVRNAFETAMNSQEATHLEFYNDNLEFWVEANLHPSETGISVYFRDVTERKERERELEETERLYQTLVEHFPNGAVALVDTDSRYITFGGVPEGDVDVTRADLEGSLVSDLPEQIRDVVTPHYDAALEGETSTLERKIDGKIYQFRFVPVRDAAGDIFAALGLSQEVTEQKEREQAIRESERRYRTLVENFPNGIVTLFDEELRYTLAEGQAFDDLSHSRDDIEGHHLHEVWADDVVEMIEPAFRAALDGEKQSVEGESEGREWILHVVPLADQDGEIHGGMTMALDITERKERERELAKYETIVETVNDGIYTVDEDGHFTMVNDTYTELTGYSREELLGSHASLVVDDETIEEAKTAETEIREGHADGPKLEAAVQTADGDRVPAEATFSVLPGDERKRIGVVRDITERKERERALEESERRYRTLAENFPNGAVGLYDDDLRYTAIGGELVDAVGVSPEDRIGNSVYDIYPDDFVEEVEPYFEAALEGEANSFEVEYHDRNLFAYTLPVRNDVEGVNGTRNRASHGALTARQVTGDDPGDGVPSRTRTARHRNRHCLGKTRREEAGRARL